MKTPKYIDKHAGRVKDFGKTLEEEYPKVTPIEELKWETGLDMLMTELVTCAGIGMAEKHRRQRIIKFVTKTIESERKKVVKEMKKLYSLNKSDAYNNAITDAIKLLK